MAQPMTSPQHPRSSGLDANARGIAVLAAALLIGFLLLWKAGGPDGSQEARAVTTTTVDTSGIGGEITTTTSTAGTTSTVAGGTEGREPSKVTVLVLNSGAPTGSAATTTATIDSAGYKTADPADAIDRSLATTAVYYAPGYQAEATSVAALLGKPASVVAPMPATAPGPGADRANVVVALGRDTVSSGSGSSTTTTSTTTATGN